MARSPVWIRWFPKDAMDGMAQLAPMEELAYRRILDLIITTGDALRDDDRALAWMTKAGRQWRAIKVRLIDMGKITVDAGFIRNTWLGFDAMQTLPGRPYEPGWAALRAAVFERDRFTCTYCGEQDGPLDCDHVLPVALGGVSTMENLVAACAPCNRSKGARLVSDWRRA